MVTFTDEDIFRLDERYAAEGIPFHARPLHAATEILGERFVMGTLRNPMAEKIQRAYAQLIPQVDFTWPGMGTGLAASVDQVKKVVIGIAFGEVSISISGGLGFATHEEWLKWCRGNSNTAARSAFSFADMHDLVYGINQYHELEGAKAFWGLASGQLEMVAENLSQSGAVNSAVLQPICLAAELAMKGTLLHLGVSENELRYKPYGHNLLNIAQAMTEKCRHRDDPLVLSALNRFPDYVGDRYRETTLSRIQIIELALDAQFVAASSVRRISGDDFASQLEGNWPGPRGKLAK